MESNKGAECKSRILPRTIARPNPIRYGSLAPRRLALVLRHASNAKVDGNRTANLKLSSPAIRELRVLSLSLPISLSLSLSTPLSLCLSLSPSISLSLSLSTPLSVATLLRSAIHECGYNSCGMLDFPWLFSFHFGPLGPSRGGVPPPRTPRFFPWGAPAPPDPPGCFPVLRPAGPVPMLFTQTRCDTEAAPASDPARPPHESTAQVQRRFWTMNGLRNGRIVSVRGSRTRSTLHIENHFMGHGRVGFRGPG